MTPSARDIHRAEIVALAAAVLGSLYLIAHLVAFEYGRDQGIYAVVASTILHGGAPYKDAWDFKPPAIYAYFVAARALFGASMHAVRVVEAALLASMLWAFVVLSRRHLGSWRAGVLGWTAAVLAYVPLGFWHTAQPETFACSALAWAWVCAGHRGRREALAWAGAGVLFGIAALLKPPLGGGAVVSAAVVAWTRRGRDGLPPWRRFGVPVLAVGGGGLAALAATLLFFAAHGALGDLYDVFFVFAPGYTALGFHAGALPAALWRALSEWIFRFSPVAIIGLLPLALLPAVHEREREGVAHVLGTVLFALAGVAAQAKFFAYHYGAAVPLTGLLVGWGVWKGWLRVRRYFLAWPLVAALIVAAVAGWIPGLPRDEAFRERSRARLDALAAPATERRAILDRAYSKGDVEMAADRAVAGWLRAHTATGEPVFVWGFEPVIYDLSDRPPASRYIYDVPQRAPWYRLEARNRLMADLEASAPAAVIVQHGDALPLVTGNDRDSAAELATFPELQRWLVANYRPTARAGDLEIHKRFNR